jgi:hypothetical protein
MPMSNATLLARILRRPFSSRSVTTQVHPATATVASTMMPASMVPIPKLSCPGMRAHVRGGRPGREQPSPGLSLVCTMSVCGAHWFPRGRAFAGTTPPSWGRALPLDHPHDRLGVLGLAAFIEEAGCGSSALASRKLRRSPVLGLRGASAWPRQRRPGAYMTVRTRNSRRSDPHDGGVSAHRRPWP